MATYKMEDGVIVKTENATQKWEEDTFWNGSNHISRATGSQWSHETLYLSKKGNYWIEHTSQMQGSVDHAEWIDQHGAATWLIVNGHELPEDLKEREEEITE